MKPIIITIGILLAGLTVATLNLRTTNTELREQLQTALGYREQLNKQAEKYTRQRMEWDARLAELETQLLSTVTQLNNLSETLQEAREQVNPDYELLLEQARREVAQNNPPQRRREGGMNVLSDPDAAFTVAEASVDSNYSGFFDLVRLSPTERETVGAAIVDFTANRLQLLRDMISGDLSPEIAAAYFGPNALLNNLSQILSQEQLEQLQDYELAANQQTTRDTYAGMFAGNNSTISGLTQELVLDVLMEELHSASNNFGAMVSANGSLAEAMGGRELAFERARNRLGNDLNQEQLAQYDRFAQEQSNTINFTLTASSTDGEQQQVQVMRVISDNPPN